MGCSPGAEPPTPVLQASKELPVFTGEFGIGIDRCDRLTGPLARILQACHAEVQADHGRRTSQVSSSSTDSSANLLSSDWAERGLTDRTARADD